MSSGYRDTSTWMGSEDIVPAPQCPQTRDGEPVKDGSSLSLHSLLYGPACAESLPGRNPCDTQQGVKQAVKVP